MLFLLFQGAARSLPPCNLPPQIVWWKRWGLGPEDTGWDQSLDQEVKAGGRPSRKGQEAAATARKGCSNADLSPGSFLLCPVVGWGLYKATCLGPQKQTQREHRRAAMASWQGGR